MNHREMRKLTDKEKKLVVAKGGGGVGMSWETGVSRCKLLHTEWINNKFLLYSIGNCNQYPEISHNGKEYLKDCIYVYINATLYCAAEITPWKSTVFK